MWVCYFPFPSLRTICKRTFIITMIRVICDLTLLQYRQKPFMLTYLGIYKVKSFKTIRKFCTINDILCIHLMPQLSRLVVYRLYRYRNCLYVKEIWVSDWAYLAPCGIINFQLTRLVISTPKIMVYLNKNKQHDIYFTRA